MKYLKSYKLFESEDYSHLSNVPPETLEDQIAFAIRWYPGLYDKKYGRLKVLNQMYLTVGGGYEWIDGKLLDDMYQSDSEKYSEKVSRWDYEKTELQKTLNRLIEFFHKTPDSKESNDTYLEDIQKDIDDIQNQIDDFDHWRSKYPCEETPLSFKNMENYSKKYSGIFNIPNNVTEEYLNGAKELINYILSFTDKKDTNLYKDIRELANELGM